MAIATGGTITIDGAYTVHKFTSNDSFILSKQVTAAVLVVGGGGGGGMFGGGGGAGGLVYQAAKVIVPGTYAVTIGGGGAGDLTTSGTGGNGDPSSFGDMTALGGGGGGSRTATPGANGVNGANGGSAGGGSASDNDPQGLGGTKTQGDSDGGTGYGNNGGNGGNHGWGSGGGGGAGASGSNASSNTPGAGGVGLAYDIVEEGTDVYYAGGGGGATYSASGALGGLGGGGKGDETNGSDGTANTGGGGGGGGYNTAGHAGGSGIVVVRYLTDLSGNSNTYLQAGITEAGEDYLTTYVNGELIEKKAPELTEIYKTTRIGDTSNYCQISDEGAITYAGTSVRHLAMRPSFVAGRIAGTAKPTPVAVGVWAGYSCPIFSSDDEELFWRLHVPGRWDGASDITYNLIVCLSAAETEGDDFKFQLSWNHSTNSDAIDAASVQDLEASGDCTAGHTAQYSVFKLAFTIDWDIDTPDIVVGDTLAGRVRRIASGGTEVSNEIIVLDHYLNFQVDKVYKA